MSLSTASATPSAQCGSRGMGRSLASAENGGRGAGRPGLGGRDRLDLDVEAGELHDLAGQLAPGAVAAAGHVVEAGAEAAAQGLVDGRGEVAGVGGRADLVVDDAQRLARRRPLRAPPPGSSSRSCGRSR